MNKLLLRQLKKFFPHFDFADSKTETFVRNLPKEIQELIRAIDKTYDGFDEDRNLTVRSLDLSSQELIEANRKLREEAETQKAILTDLRTATAALRPTGAKKDWLTSKDEVVYLANSLAHLIAEEKQHEKELEETKERAEQERAKAEAILKSIGDGVFAVDLDCKVILMNSIAEQLTGFSFSEAQGKNYQEIFRCIKEKEPEVAYPDFVKDVIETGQIKQLTNHTLLIRKDNSQIPISDSAAPIKDDSGKIIGCIVVVRDASRERALEQAKDDFISIAAHQLRTPLGSIRWNLEMTLKTNELSQKEKERIGRIYKSNQRIIDLVNDLLDVSRIDQGRVANEPEWMNPCDVIRATTLDMDAAALEQKVMIKLFLPENFSKKIYIDSKRFREVIENLLSNAVKYSTEGGEVIVDVELLDDELVVGVSDQGMGIPIEDQPRVFSKFYRAENAAKSETSGSGLGLFVVKSYVEGWGGRVWFTSIPGKGSTFYIQIPFHINYSNRDEATFHAEGIGKIAKHD